MMQYRLLKVLFATIISLFLCACVDKEDEFDMQFSSTDRPISELVTCEYSNSELEDIVSTATTIQALNARYPVECIRDCGNIVRVSYCGDDAVAVILFDNKGNRIMGRVFTTYRLKDDFETINIGSCLNDVQQIDPDGNYLFLITGRNDIPRESVHCTKDGYLITIKYTYDNAVSELLVEYL